MRPICRPAQRLLSLLCGGLFACTTQAALQPMDDRELAEVTGQALITMDGLTYGGFEYTRVNLGSDIDLLTNIDELRLGNYSRTGGGTASTQPADIRIDNFALGRVDNANSPNAAIVPFQIRDPYLEFAFKVNGQGVREVAGVRVGFGRARGDLSGDIRSLTGVMQGKIYGPASIAYQYYRDTNGCGFLGLDPNCIALSLAGDTEVYAEVELLQQGTGVTTLNGQPINRATHIGIPNGQSLQTDETGLIAALLPTLSTTSDCQALGLTTCFALLNYKSIFVGDPTKPDITQGGAQGIFFSMQNQNVPWQDLANTGKFVDTQSGAFANFAKTGEGANALYPFMINLYDALRGTARVPTCIGGQTSGC
ncbi:DUF6160 family protein [Pseudomonas sp. UBA2684]|uniref:DUF6160 family protein n=1 Tax=Pseudomonas sp. UBA2684 TaxID=1947311 RepID=UPI000E9E6AC1|nr:DUF6160 family protein [Pseudomonas sp. UBA2684]HBX54112.1 hypothetical protein [Pseudomonas sp.]|tara:strand:- start:12482 stop:13579 length:1098 start_codon:yes stop_codon:yes gene_type:complete